MPSFDLIDHLKKEHHRTPFATYLREIVYGGTDGIVTTFAVIAGFAGAQKGPTAGTIPLASVLLFGLANLFADGLSMSLGSFLSLRANQDVYKNEKEKERSEIISSPDNEFEETVEILIQKNFLRHDAIQIAKLYRNNTRYWTEFMMTHELSLPNPESEKPYRVALATFGAFVIFGAIPLTPYILRFPAGMLFSSSLGFSGLALVLLGILRARVSRQKPFRTTVETLLVGGTAASVAHLVGSLFRF